MTIHFFSSKGEFDNNNKSPFPLDILYLDDFAVYVRQLQTRQGEYISLSSLTHPSAGYAAKAIPHSSSIEGSVVFLKYTLESLTYTVRNLAKIPR